MRGTCIHHDNGIIGAATLPDAEYFRVKKLKEAGFNAIRSAHHPASRALLDACDEIGMLVMDKAAVQTSGGAEALNDVMGSMEEDIIT